MRSLASKALPTVAFVLGLGLAVVDAPSSADTSDPPTDPADDGYPEPGFETGPIHPFDPSTPDPSDVEVDDLTAEEQAYVDANADTSAWPSVHNAFAAATTQAAADAEAQAAANLVSLDGFQNLGVLP